MSATSAAMLGDLQWARARWLIATLCKAGIRHLIFSPGSRSAPLVLAARLDARLRLHAIIDERTAGFAALGIAREKPASVAVLATSGSAPGHWLPAVMEASATARSMLLLSADRPASLHFRGANQTVEQRHLFNDFVDLREDIDLALASPEHVRACIERVIRVLSEPAARPVHLNLRLHKPLEPSEAAYTASLDVLCKHAAQTSLTPGPNSPRLSRVAVANGASQTPCPAKEAGAAHAPRELVEALRSGPRRIVVVGPLGPDPAIANAILRLAHRFRVPIWAHRSSNLTASRRDMLAPSGADWTDAGQSPHVAVTPTIALHHGPEAPGANLEPPSHILTLGSAPVSGGLPPHWLEAEPFIGTISLRQRTDPDARGALHWLTRDLKASLCTVAAAAIDAYTPTQEAWLRAYQDQGPKPTRLAAAASVRRARLTTPLLLQGLGDLLPNGTRVLLGNSLIIREVERYADDSWSKLRLYCQRGLSGIDGLVAGALGHHLAAPEVPLMLMLGDVSFAHDCGALAAIAQARGPILVVVLDNGGGRLFDRLPLGSTRHLVSHLDDFHTPPRLDVCALAQAHRLEAHTPSSLSSWHKVVRTLATARSPHVCVITS